jgi:hypothetical protein
MLCGDLYINHINYNNHKYINVNYDNEHDYNHSRIILR